MRLIIKMYIRGKLSNVSFKDFYGSWKAQKCTQKILVEISIMKCSTISFPVLRLSNTVSWLDSDDDFCSGCRNVRQFHHKQSFSGLHSPGRSRCSWKKMASQDVLYWGTSIRRVLVTSSPPCWRTFNKRCLIISFFMVHQHGRHAIGPLNL